MTENLQDEVQNVTPDSITLQDQSNPNKKVVLSFIEGVFSIDLVETHEEITNILKQ